MQKIIRQRGTGPRAASCRNAGRYHLGMPGRLRRNPHILIGTSPNLLKWICHGAETCSRQQHKGEDETQSLREGIAPASGRALPFAGLGERKGRAHHHPVRGTRRRWQGRDHQGAYRAGKPADVPGGGASGSLRSPKIPDVHAALHPAIPRGGRDHHLRSQLVQSRRRRIRHGILQ